MHLPRVVAVHQSAGHHFSKQSVLSLELRAGLGVVGDAHMGSTVQHRYDVRRNPAKPNLRQVHLIAQEFLAALAARGFNLLPGQMGENITTSGVALTQLPAGTRLHLGPEAVVELTGLRKPCVLIDRFRAGLLRSVVQASSHVTGKDEAGVMSIVLQGGSLQAGDAVAVELPRTPYRRLEYV